MKSPFNPKILVWTLEGKPAPKAKVFFFNKGTDVPKSVKYVEGGTLTNEITADSSGDFPQVEFLEGDYTLKAFIPIDPKEAYPLFPEDYEFRDSWDLSGEAIPGEDITEAQVQVGSLQALREYNGDAEKVWVGNRLFIKDEYVSQTDNNGTIIISIALTGVVWRMDLTGYDTTSLDWFEADKTGATDSTAAFIAAISAIYNNGSGPAKYRLPGTLYIPNGTYLVNSEISFTCPVIMESGTRFYNNTGSQVDLKFNKGLDTNKMDLFYVDGTGLSPVVPKFPQRLPNGKVQTVSLQWYSSDYVEISWFPYEVSFVGEGTINTADMTQHTIKSVIGSGDIVFLTTAGKPPCIVKEFSCAPLGLEVQGTGSVYFGSLNITYLKTASDINRCEGAELIIGKNWTIDFDATFKFSSVHGNKTSLTISNDSGTSHTIGATGDVDFESFTWVLHDLIPTFKTEPKNFDWTGADSDDWNNYLVNGSNDFTGTSTSGDINLTSDATLENLNHTGTMMAFGHSLVLNSCKINLTSGKEVRGSALTISDSSILTDDPANGQIVSSNMRLRNSLITCPVNLYGADNMQLEMRGCRFTNQVSVSSSYTLQTLVATHNEVGLCNFIPYTIYCHGLSDAAKVSIDISENWTTDLTGQLVHSKGFAKTKPHWNGDQHFYFQPYEAIGILDIRNNTVENSPSLAANSRIHAYFVSGGDDDYQPIVNTYTNFAGAIKLDGVSSLSERRNITFDAWNTQAYEE